MALNIPALAGLGVDLAWTLGDSAMADVTVNQGPTPVYVASTDVTTITWATTVTKRGLLYAATLEEIDPSGGEELNAFLEGRAKKLLLRASDLPAAITTGDQVVIGGVTWDVKLATPDPVNKIYVVHLRR